MNFLAWISAPVALVLILGAPFPLASGLAARLLPTRCTVASEQWLAICLLWLALQLSGATLLAATGFFTLLGICLWQALLLALGWRWRQPLPPLLQPFLPLGLLGGSLFFLTLLLFGNLLSQPITDYDSLYYHLPFVATLHATGKLLPHAVAAVVAWYPFGWETLSTLLVVPLRHDLLVTLPNLLVWGMWGGAVYRLARRLGAPRNAAGSAVILLVSQPLVIDQLNSVRVDLALAALFTTGLTFAVLYHQERQLGALLLALLALPLLAALKSSGLIYGLVLLAMLGLLPLTRRRAIQLPNGATLLVCLVILGGSGLAAGYWYGQNWVTYDNPLGAVAVQVGGWSLFPGSITAEQIRRTTLLSLFVPSNLTHWRALATQLWVQGGLPGVTLLVLALAAWWPRPMPQKSSQFAANKNFLDADKRENPRIKKKIRIFSRLSASRFINVIALTLLVGLLLALYWVTPYSGDDGTYGYQFTPEWLGQSLRFALAASGMLAVLAALGSARLVSGAPWWPLVAVGLALFTLAQRSTLYLLAVLLFAVSVLGWWLLGRWRNGQQMQHGFQQLLNEHPCFVGGGVLVLLVSMALVLTPVRAQRRAQAYGELPTIVATTIPAQATITAFYSHQSYLATGPTLQYRVIQAPLTITSVDALLTWLDQQASDFVIFGPLLPQWQREALRAELAQTADFILLYDGSPTHPLLYQVTRR